MIAAFGAPAVLRQTQRNSMGLSQIVVAVDTSHRLHISFIKKVAALSVKETGLRKYCAQLQDHPEKLEDEPQLGSGLLNVSHIRTNGLESAFSKP